MVSRTTRRHFHVQEDIWTSVHTHDSQPNNPTKTPFVGSSHGQWDVSFTYSATHNRIGREYNVNVCVLGSDLMWLKHILMSNSWPSRCPSCDQPLLPCWKVWTWCYWQLFGRGDWGLVARREFFWMWTKFSTHCTYSLVLNLVSGIVSGTKT